jgi:oxygen-independent coproporphyrinogen III oxidase
VEWLSAGGVGQYEISNFARVGGDSVHNRKYWERKDYLGFGMDAHSMLRVGAGGVRWANADSMSAYGDRLGQFERAVDRVDERAGFEESLFLGLRLVDGVSLASLDARCLGEIGDALAEVEGAGLLVRDGDRVRLTDAGRMASNEVFGRLLLVSV